MVVKHVSYKEIIARVFRDFKPDNSNWVNEAPNWIYDFVERVGSIIQLTRLTKQVEIVDYISEYPCELVSVLGIYCEGVKITQHDNNPPQEFIDKSQFINVPMNMNMIHSRRFDNVLHSQLYYVSRGSHFEYNFTDKTVDIEGYYMNVDCDGFPLIVDNIHLKDSLAWYIIYKMCLQGFKHPVVDFKLAEKNWREGLVRAQNSLVEPTREDLELIKSTLIRLMPPTKFNYFNELN